MSDRLGLQASLAPEVDVLTPTLALMPVALMVTDSSGEVRWANTWPEELAGYRGEQMRGVPAWKPESGETREMAACRSCSGRRNYWVKFEKCWTHRSC